MYDTRAITGPSLIFLFYNIFSFLFLGETKWVIF